MNASKKTALVVKTNLKAGLSAMNHNRAALKKSGLATKSGVKAGLGE
jgi:hypothetical protein